MRKHLIKLSTSVMIIALLFNYGYCQSKVTIDYGGLNLAKQFANDGNYVFAYKYLLIFKYTNFQRLNSKENTDALKKIDENIRQIENILLQTYSLVDEKKMRGFAENRTDSLDKMHRKIVIAQDIEIK